MRWEGDGVADVGGGWQGKVMGEEDERDALSEPLSDLVWIT